MSPAAVAARLPEFVALARAAGREILAHRGAGARRKADSSPVTDADEAAEAVLLAGLGGLTPDLPIVSEEQVSAGTGGFVGETPPSFWLVDPLDGTREFVAGRDTFSVNLALIVGRFPALGVVHDPVGDVTWTGTATGATRIESGAARPIRTRPPPSAGLDVVSSFSHGDEAALAGFLDEESVASHRRLGSAIKFGLLAEGKADLYPRFGATMEWDTAAGQAVLEAAGGRVETLAGARLAYGKPGFRNPDFIARGARA